MIAVALVGIYRTGGQDRPADVVRAKLSSGESIGDLLTSTKRSVVLVYSPEDCLACATVLGRWVQFGRDKDVVVRLVLTEEPPVSIANALKRFRINVAGILAEEEPLAVDSAAAYVFDGSTLVDYGMGELSQVGLLRKLTYERPRP